MGGSSGCACDTTWGSEGTANGSLRIGLFGTGSAPQLCGTTIAPKAFTVLRRAAAKGPTPYVYGVAPPGTLPRSGGARFAGLRLSASGRISAAVTARVSAAFLHRSRPSPIGAASPCCPSCAKVPLGSFLREMTRIGTVRCGDTDNGTGHSLDLVERHPAPAAGAATLRPNGGPGHGRQPGQNPTMSKHCGRQGAPRRRSCSVLAWGAHCSRRRCNSRFRSRLDSSPKPDHSGRAQSRNATPAAQFPADSSLHSRPAPPLRIRTYATPATARTGVEGTALVRTISGLDEFELIGLPRRAAMTPRSKPPARIRAKKRATLSDHPTAIAGS